MMKYVIVAIMQYHNRYLKLNKIITFILLVSSDLFSKYLVFNLIDLFRSIRITNFLDIILESINYKLIRFITTGIL